eukprot:TRINITY_DN4066_c0_g1_i1.p1 TRINITY_DN4066_c0_g1~~TRINITY_DN4066_c0_g1_i1.p1  ORF type:complete len:895 (+),score=300.33 TRINITY_DN4066_c0_g1_i1:63-2687(+)
MPDVKVEAMVRVRPFNRRELEIVRQENAGECKSIVSMHGRRVALLNPADGWRESEAFDFDAAFWSVPKEQMMSGGIDLDDPAMLQVAKQMGIDHVVTQQEVYEKTGARCVQHAFEGFHSCIFAYGQTGAGKTFTMMGGLDEKGGLDESAKGREMRGVCLRLVEDLFAKIEQRRDDGEKTVFKVYLSFMEIYKEKCKDLLVKAGKKKSTEEAEKDYADLKVRHSPSDGTYVQGLERKEIKNPAHCFALMAYGMNCRHTAATKMNDVSSRSHAIFQITFKQQDPLQGVNTLSNINLVDLAGSERIKMSGATEGTRRDEATKINMSLSTLRRVIDTLVDNARKKQQSRPPYRESMLTWVLMESLGGNSKTIMIAAVSPFSGNYEDSLNTLRYANKAKDIVCKAKRNDEKGQMIVSAMRGAMDQLRQQLKEKTEEMDEAARLQLEQDLAAKEDELRRAEQEEEELRQQRESLAQAHTQLEQHAQEQRAAAEELRRMQEEAALLQIKRRDMEREAVEAEERTKEVARMKAEAERSIQAQLLAREALENEARELKRKEQETQAEILSTRQQALARAFKAAVVLWKGKMEMESLKVRHAVATDSLPSVREEAAQADAAVKEQMDAIAAMQGRKENAERACKDLHTAVDQERASLERRRAEAEEVVKKLRETSKGLESAIQTAVQEGEDLRVAGDSAREASQEAARELDSDAQAAMEGTRRCEREAFAARQRILTAEREVVGLRLEHDRLAEASREATRRLAQSESRLRSVKAQHALQQRQVAHAATQMGAADTARKSTADGLCQAASELRQAGQEHRDLEMLQQRQYAPTSPPVAPQLSSPGSRSSDAGARRVHIHSTSTASRWGRGGPSENAAVSLGRPK